MIRRTLLLALLVAMGTAITLYPSAGQPRSQSPTDPADTVKLTILHVNDTHGQLEPKGNSGGIARLATTLDDIRTACSNQPVLLLHAGDILSRGDALTRRTRGAANFALMNHLQFDALTPGNGEFYDGVANLRARIAQAKFPVLTANVMLKSTGRRLSEPYVILDAGGVKVAILGLCYVRMGHSSARPLQVEKPIAVAKALVGELRKRADVVVLLTHLGFLDDIKLAAQVPGVDLIVGGHSHNVLPKGHLVQGPDGANALLVQAGDYYRYLGRVDLKLRKSGGSYEIFSAKARLIPLDKHVKLDPTVTAMIARLASPTPRKTKSPAPAR